MGTAEGDKRVLCVGLCCVDIINVCSSYPLEDTDQRSLDYYWQRGGNASNSADVLALLGDNVEYFGTLIKGKEYKFLKEDFESSGVQFDKCVIYEDGKYRCPVSIVVINQQNGSRTIIAALNHLVELTFEDFDTRINLGQYKWIHFEGRRNIDDMLQMMKKINQFNTSLKESERIRVSFEMEKAARTSLLDLADQPDYLFISKEFAMGQGYSCKEEAVEGISGRCKPGASVICAWGDKGAAAKTKSCDIVTSPIFPPETLVDTLGAGDTFNAATIYALSKQKSLQDAILFGCKVAGAKCGMTGKSGLKGFQKLL